MLNRYFQFQLQQHVKYTNTLHENNSKHPKWKIFDLKKIPCMIINSPPGKSLHCSCPTNNIFFYLVNVMKMFPSAKILCQMTIVSDFKFSGTITSQWNMYRFSVLPHPLLSTKYVFWIIFRSHRHTGNVQFQICRKFFPKLITFL